MKKYIHFLVGITFLFIGMSFYCIILGRIEKNNVQKKEENVKYTLPPLPYAYDALEPCIDARTMEIHYTKHHQGYIDKLNKALEAYPNLQEKPLEELIKSINTVPPEIRTAVRNNGGGHLNHSLFWIIMDRHGGGEPKGKLAEAMKKQFGSIRAFKNEFTQQANAVFGSGWTWLAMKPDGRLFIISTSGHDTPLMEGNIPLLVLDVWEHAYYLKYQNRRADFITNWWHVVNWPKVEERYQAAL